MIVPESDMAGGERVKILDFGIAKLSESGAGKNLQTKTGALMGTPVYMSPEQCRGAGRVDEKTDVYSFGILLFEMLVGSPPFSAEGQGELIALHMFQQAPPLQHYVPEAPPELAGLIAAMLAKDATVRPTMAQVATTLQSLAAQAGQASIPPAPAVPISSSAMASTLPPSGIRGSLHTGTGTQTGGKARLPLLVGSVLLLVGAGVTAFVMTRTPPSEPSTASPTSNAVRDARAYERFATAADSGVYSQAFAAYRDIASDSPYHLKAREKYAQVFPLFVESQLKLASEARSQGRCEVFGNSVQAVLDIDPKNLKALAAKQQPCLDPSNNPPSKSDDDVDVRLAEAQTEFVNGNYIRAITIAKSVQKGSPVRAWRIIGSAACNTKDLKLLNDAYRRLDAAGRQYLVYVCQRNGIYNSGSQFKLAD